jgi:nitrate/nitrite-specific signal transduction histidine kinase
MNNILSQLKDIAAAVMYAVEARDLEQVLERIAQIAKDLVDARYVALGVPDDKGGLQYFVTVGMTPDVIAQIDHLPEGKGLLGAIMHDRQTLRLERMQDDSRAAGFCPGHPKMTSLLGVPIQVGQQLFGILYLCDRADGKPFDEQDQWLIEITAGYAALAIASSQLRGQHRRLALLEERERIGMELHDGVIQSLYALGMHVDLMRTSNDIQPDDFQPVINGLNDVIEDIRRYILNLKSESYQQQTVRGRFQQMSAQLHIPETLHVEIDAPEISPPFPPATFEAICLIANEAISNAVRHANAKHIHITAQRIDQQFQITIADDGKGFDLDTAMSQNGLGLRNIQQRARIHGGQVHIETTPDEGTTLEIVIPI